MQYWLPPHGAPWKCQAFPPFTAPLVPPLNLRANWNFTYECDVCETAIHLLKLYLNTVLLVHIFEWWIFLLYMMLLYDIIYHYICRSILPEFCNIMACLPLWLLLNPVGLLLWSYKMLSDVFGCDLVPQEKKKVDWLTQWKRKKHKTKI